MLHGKDDDAKESRVKDRRSSCAAMSMRKLKRRRGSAEQYTSQQISFDSWTRSAQSQERNPPMVNAIQKIAK